MAIENEHNIRRAAKDAKEEGERSHDNESTRALSKWTSFLEKGKSQEDTPAGRLARELEGIQEDLGTLIARSRLRLVEAIEQEFYLVIQDALRKAEPMFAPIASAADRGGLSQEKKDQLSTSSVSVQPNTSEEEAQPEPLAHVTSPSATTTQTPTTKENIVTAPLIVENEPEQELKAELKVDVKQEKKELGIQPIQEEPPMPPSRKAYEGTVRLTVKVGSRPSQALRLVDQLCTQPQMRLQRLTGDHRGGMELWLVLRESLDLEAILKAIEVVANVRPIADESSSDSGNRLLVLLKEPSESSDVKS